VKSCNQWTIRFPESVGRSMGLTASVALDSTTRKSACACADDQTRCARLVPGATASDFSAEQATNNAAKDGAGRT